MRVPRFARACAAVAVLTAAITSTCQGQVVRSRFAVPAPVAVREDNDSATAYAISNEKRASILLAQVVQVALLPGARAVDPVRAAHPRGEGDIQQAAGGQFDVLATLCGDPSASPASLEIVNPPPPDPTDPNRNLHPDLVLTRHLRVGELWLLAWDPKTRKVDLNTISGMSRLSGPDDPQIALYKLWRSWMDDPDPQRAESQMIAMALNPRLSTNTRRLAFGGIGVLVHRRQPPTDSDPVYQHVMAELLKAPDTPNRLKLDALSIVSPNSRAELRPGSDEAWLLRYVIRVLDLSYDPTWLSAASTVAAQANIIYDISVGEKVVVVLYPDLIAALERRAAKETAENPKRGGPGMYGLSRLDTHHRRSAEDARRDSHDGVIAVERRIPRE